MKEHVLSVLFSELNRQSAFGKHEVHRGAIFTAVTDDEGYTGIAAHPDADQVSHEIKYLQLVEMQALINARVNRPDKVFSKGDFLQETMFSSSEKIVMAGFIKPVFLQMQALGIQCHAFDYHKEDEALLPSNLFTEYLCDADTLITTGTSLANNSLMEMAMQMKEKARIFVIGPSVPLSGLLFDIIPHLAGLYGSIVVSNTITKKIMQGAGTRQLHDDLQKAGLQKC